ncbi:hypothetical protein [Polaribacter porphyrae]|nr:hypothetical protein [Polaribacter porphyrae]
MKFKIILLLFSFVSLSLKAQEKKVTTFHRMLILNEKNELLVVKIKNQNIWVTPGLYQNTKQSIQEGMDSIAKTYGIKVSNIELRGIYGVKAPSKNYFSTRNLFVMKTKSKHSKLPEIIDKAEWVSIKESEKFINIPYVNWFIQDVFHNPKTIRFGTVEKQLIEGKLTSKIVEQFYNF